MTNNVTSNAPYKIVREIGGGGMGLVFLALDSRTGKEVALKIMREEFKDNPELRKRFCREVRIASDLEHPNIIRIITFDIESTRPWFAMEFCRNGALLKTTPSGDAKVLIRFFIQACRGVAYAHSKGILHRDIKPWNLLHGNDGLVKVSDFGLAMLVNRDTTPITPSGSGLGTYGFMAPEQIANAKHVTEAADIYSLGVTLFYILTETLPGAHIVRPALALTGLSKGEEDEIFNLIDQCLERNPAKRPSNVEQFANALEQAIGINLSKTEISSSFDADTAVLKVLELSAQISDSELAVLRRLKIGEDIKALYQLSERYGIHESPEWYDLNSLKIKGLVTFREEDHSSGKYPQHFWLTDIAITSLGLALLHYLDRDQ